MKTPQQQKIDFSMASDRDRDSQKMNINENNNNNNHDSQISMPIKPVLERPGMEQTDVDPAIDKDDEDDSMNDETLNKSKIEMMRQLE